MNKRLDGAVSVGLLGCTVVICLSVVWRTFVRPSDVRPPNHAPIFVSDWRKAMSIGSHLSGATSAKVTIVEIGDLQCPACRAYQSLLDSVVRRHPNEVEVVFVHFPLDMHKFAVQAARGAECAKQSGHFSDWVRVVYRLQDSLGVVPWTSFALQAGMTDMTSFSACLGSPSSMDRVSAGTEFATALGANGTPTILINGWRFVALPLAGGLDTAVSHAIRGETPSTQ